MLNALTSSEDLLLLARTKLSGDMKSLVFNIQKTLKKIHLVYFPMILCLCGIYVIHSLAANSLYLSYTELFDGLVELEGRLICIVYPYPVWFCW